jgi:hypothetical protein
MGQRFQQMSYKNFTINRPALQKKATKTALRLNIYNFKASDGWVTRFKKCHGITCKFVCGERKMKLQNTGRNPLPHLLQDYEPRHIYNAAETGCFTTCSTTRVNPCKGGKTM